MSQSSTIIAALRFDGGVVIGSDSQTSDPLGAVRWPTEKLSQINDNPLIVGFSGQLAPARRMLDALRSRFNRQTSFHRQSRVVDGIEAALSPLYKELSRQHPNAQWNDSIWKITVWGLAAYWAEGSPRILEIEANGQCDDSHEQFRAIGSGVNSAYSAWRVLGSTSLSYLPEGPALRVMWMILKACIETDLWGVSDPINMWVVTENKARRVGNSEMDGLKQFAILNLPSFVRESLEK